MVASLLVWKCSTAIADMILEDDNLDDDSEDEEEDEDGNEIEGDKADDDDIDGLADVDRQPRAPAEPQSKETKKNQ